MSYSLNSIKGVILGDDIAFRVYMGLYSIGFRVEGLNSLKEVI